jgi:hypothetical protein
MFAAIAVALLAGMIRQDPVISSLGVRIQTSGDVFAGSSGDLGVFDSFVAPPYSTYLGDDNVWFDIGPRAWKLNGTRRWQTRSGFPAGSTVTVNIDLNDDTGDEDGTTGPNPVLHVSDIARFRLVKQGIGGYTNAPDNVGELLGIQPGPAGLMAFFQNAAKVQSYTLGRASAVLGTASSRVKQLSDQVARETQREQALETRRNGLVERIHFLQARVTDSHVKLATLPLHIQVGVHIYQPKVTRKILGNKITIPLGPPIPIPDFGPNPAIDLLNKAIGVDSQEIPLKQAAVDQLNAQIQQATLGLADLNTALTAASQGMSAAQKTLEAAQAVTDEIFC